MQFRQFQPSKEVLMAVFCNEKDNQVNTSVYPPRSFPCINSAIQTNYGLDLKSTATFAHPDVAYENQNQYLEFKGSGPYEKIESLFNDLVAAGYSVYGYGIKNNATAILKMNTFNDLWAHEILNKQVKINELNNCLNEIKRSKLENPSKDEDDFLSNLENEIQEQIQYIVTKQNKLVEISDHHQNSVNSSANVNRHSR